MNHVDVLFVTLDLVVRAAGGGGGSGAFNGVKSGLREQRWPRRRLGCASALGKRGSLRCGYGDMGFGGRGITFLYVRQTARKPRVSIRDISMRFEMSYTMSPGLADCSSRDRLSLTLSPCLLANPLAPRPKAKY